MTDRDIQRWSREVAVDPGAPSFVRLARAYRRQGRRGAARDIVVRGLARNPEHLEGHSLLALMHVEEGDPLRARDEWETVLRLEPGHFDACRGLGFLALERCEFHAARRHLEAASRARPADSTVTQALQVLDRKTAAATPRPDPRPPTPTGSRAETSTEGSTGSPAETPAETPPETPAEAPAETLAETPAETPSGAGPGADAAPWEPDHLFRPLDGEPCFAGALILDAHGRVLAGALAEEGEDSGALLGALLDSVVAEADRTTDLVQLGGWQELMVECEKATMHVAPLDDGAVVVSKLRPRTPAGWVVRLASTARGLARRFMEVAP
jgi:predicted regulator of Ras-like GTPase activity (Roadblock/LC7/MglB family)